MIVVDVNILIYHEVAGPFTSKTKELLAKDSQWLTTTLWSFEFVNVLSTMMRTKVLKLDRALEIFRAAESAYRDAEIALSQEDVLRAAHRYGISGYDAEYIA